MPRLSARFRALWITATGAVAKVAALGNDAFQAHFARGLIELHITSDHNRFYDLELRENVQKLLLAAIVESLPTRAYQTASSIELSRTERIRMSYALTLVFACGIGCGEPAQVTVTTPYATSQDCDMAGQGWIGPSANPQGAIDHYSCTSQSTILDPSTSGAPQPQPSGG